MQAPWNRAAKLTLAASCVAAILTGCKQPAEQADAAMHAQLVAANDQWDKSQDPDVAVTYFQKATAIPGTSPLAKIRSQLALADANAHAADALIAKIEERQADIIGLTSQINQQANVIQFNNVQIAGFKALDPKAAQDALAKLQATAQGGSDGAAWMPAAGGAIPSSTGAKARAADLKDQIDKLTTQKNNLQTQRAQLLQQAEQLRAQSDAAKGKQSVDLFTQSAKLTKQAADLAIQSDGLDSQISAAQQDLALAEAAQKQVDAAVDSLNKQSDQIKAAWAEMQKAIAARSDQNAALLNAASPDASAPPADATAAAATGADTSTTIFAVAAAIDKLKTDNTTSRELAEKNLTDALTALKSADTARAQLVRTYTTQMNEPNMREAAQREAWQGMIDVLNPSDMKLSMALIDLRLARLYSDWANTTANRALSARLLDGALSPASLTPPDSLKAGSLNDELADAKKKAEAAFTDADDLLTDVQKSPGSGPLAKSAQTQAQAVQLAELYSHAKFADAMGDAKTAKDYMSRSKQVRDDALAANVQLAALPPELAPAVAASPAPATHPAAAAPSTTPATPATPEAPPANPGGVFQAPATPAPATTPPAPTPSPAAPAAPAAPGATPATPPQ
jgi:hypothetical protein